MSRRTIAKPQSRDATLRELQDIVGKEDTLAAFLVKQHRIVHEVVNAVLSGQTNLSHAKALILQAMLLEMRRQIDATRSTIAEMKGATPSE